MKHIAILKQPFYDMILNGKKTIESRWSMRKIAPYNKVFIGDEIYFKETGKKITAKAIVKAVKYYELTPEIVKSIQFQFGKQIGMDYFEDLQNISHKKFCTLIWLKNVERIAPIQTPRSNGAGWICLK